jgi:hypothetical protein
MFDAKEWYRGEDGVAVGRVEAVRDLDTDGGMRDGVQSSQRRRVMEHHLGDERAIERTLLVEDGTAERVDQRRQGGAAGFRDVVSHVVGVDHSETQAPEAISDRRLSGADTPGDDNSFH